MQLHYRNNFKTVGIVCRRFWAMSIASQRGRPNRRQTTCREHASKKIRSSKILELYILLTVTPAYCRMIGKCDCDCYRGLVYHAIALVTWGDPLKAITLQEADLKFCDCDRPVIKMEGIAISDQRSKCTKRCDTRISRDTYSISRALPQEQEGVIPPGASLHVDIWI